MRVIGIAVGIGALMVASSGIGCATPAVAKPTRCIEEAFRYADRSHERYSEEWQAAAADYMDRNCVDEGGSGGGNGIDWWYVCVSNPGFCKEYGS